MSSYYSTGTEKYCYNPFGCYEMSYPWADEILRPVSYVPESPEKVNPKYCLYTQHNMDICQVCLKYSTLNSVFNT